MPLQATVFRPGSRCCRDIKKKRQRMGIKGYPDQVLKGFNSKPGWLLGLALDCGKKKITVPVISAERKVSSARLLAITQ